MSGALRLGTSRLRVTRLDLKALPEGEVMKIRSPRAALDLISRLALDPHNLTELRRMHGADRAAALRGPADREVIDRIATKIATGALSVVVLPPHGVTISLIGSGAEVKPKPPPPPKPKKPEPPPATISLVGWSKPRVAVGAKIQAIFSVTGFEGGESATVTIFELDGSGARKESAKVKATVEKTDGEVRVDWTRSEDEANADLEEDKEAGDSGPVEYRFQVKAGKLSAEGESGPLWLTHTVEVKIEAAEDDTKVILHDAIGDEHTAKTKDGKATFEDILVGPFKVSLGNPPSPFSDLRWSVPKVPVGDEVEAIFKYEGLKKKQPVEVRIVEHDADGSATLVESLEVEVDAESGEQHVKWKRSEDGVNADAQEDQEDGDTGPVDYRFEVIAGAARSAERSGPLYLTHTVEVDLGAVADGTELELVAADETVHAGTAKGGKVSFEDVVVGPLLLKLKGDGA